MAARVVQLYCPEPDVTVDNFMITPSMEGDDFEMSAKAAFRTKGVEIENIWPCDINAEPLFEVLGCPSAFSEVMNGERLLIKVDEDESLHPDPSSRRCCTWKTTTCQSLCV
jgi:hypothetical protein